jgi:hypothetical protein
MVMEQIPCVYCGDFFDPSPRHKNQTACNKVNCQKAKKAERNRIGQALRNRRARSSPDATDVDPTLIAKMDASKSDNFQILGQFWLLPVIAKMDALKVNIIKIPVCYP